MLKYAEQVVQYATISVNKVDRECMFTFTCMCIK